MKNKSIFYCLLLIMLLVATMFSCPNKISVKEITVEIKDPITGMITSSESIPVTSGTTFESIEKSLPKVEDTVVGDTKYVFEGWSKTEQVTPEEMPELIKKEDKITKDTSFYPVYSTVKLDCEIKFYIYDDEEEIYTLKKATKVPGGITFGSLTPDQMPEDSTFIRSADGIVYKFVFWANDPNTKTPVDISKRAVSDKDIYKEDTIIKGNVELKAVYKSQEMKYTVKFMGYDKDQTKYVQLSEVEAAHGDTFSKFTPPRVELREFIHNQTKFTYEGWTESSPTSDAPVSSGAIVSPSSKVSKVETVYYAKYTKESTRVNITFKAFNPSTGVYENLDTSISVPGNSRFSDYKTQRFAPEIEYNQTEYMMIGWQEDSSSSILIDKTPIGDDYIISKDTEFYAIYSKDTSLKLTALENNVTVAIWINGTTPDAPFLPQNISLLYKKSGEHEYSPYTWGGKTSPDKQTRQGKEIVLNQGEKVYIKGNNNSFSGQDAYVFINVYDSKKVSASGSVMSLVGDKTSIPSDYCFQKLFANCVGLTTAPVLPATTLKPGCYWGMFEGCIALTEAPALPARNLETSCYAKMFLGCIALTEAPALPATVAKESCYNGMFQTCTNLETAPTIALTTVASYCCANMFSGCTILEEAPSLPCVDLTGAEGCYSSMFYGCRSLTTAQTLPATKLSKSCYANMFGYCSLLTTLPDNMLPALAVEEASYQGMFFGCTSLTAAPALPATTVAKQCYNGMFVNCTNLETAPNNLSAPILAYQCYASMFQNCSKLVTPPTLSATKLATQCYYSMFQGCTSLTRTPDLSVQNLEAGCYAYMFDGCTSLTQVPNTLPATKAVAACYSYMFQNCSALTTAPTLPATQLEDECYRSMFLGCSKLAAAPALPATTLAPMCYHAMFDSCTSLTESPELKATALVSNCYTNMFRLCSKLNKITIYADNITTETRSWLNNIIAGVAETGTFVCKSNAKTVLEGYKGYIGIREGWTIDGTL